MYRIKPSAGHEPFVRYEGNKNLNVKELIHVPNQLRWDPFSLPEEAKNVDFVDGLSIVCSAGSVENRHGLNVLIYSFNAPMKNRAIYNSDGDFLLVPQLNALQVKTELGTLRVEVNEICVIPRGIVFQINNEGDTVEGARGYILEIFGGHFELPDLGPIGANGLANPQDFVYPNAQFDREEKAESWRIVNKYGNCLFEAKRNGTPFNVVAWRGNYAPYKYDLKRFTVINSVSWDHPDPSIFTVLTCKGGHDGSPIADFVIFPPRWQVSEHTFRPPYFHRNAMSEFMGLILGDYEAKRDGGFRPGGASLHSMMTPHGPDLETFMAATADPETAPLKPVKIAQNTMAFMFESSLMLGVTPWAMEKVQQDYYKVWQDLPESSKI